MKTTLIAGATCAAIVAFVYAFALRQPEAGAAPPKNLQVLPKSMDEKQVKRVMKSWSKALGVECDFCHDDAKGYAFDTKHKKVARQMARMVRAINTKHLKTYKAKVTCNTCHRGHKEPK